MRSLRFRLLIVLSCGLALLLLVTALFLDLQVRTQLTSVFDDHLASSARAMSLFSEQTEDGVDFAPDEEEQEHLNHGDEPDLYEVWLADGETIAHSEQLGESELPRETGPVEAPEFRTTTLGESSVRVAGIHFVPHLDNEDDDEDDEFEVPPDSELIRPTVHLAVARSTDEMDAAIAGFRQVIAIAFVGALVVGGAGIWWLLGSGLRPLWQASEQIAALNENRLSDRIETVGVPDEVAPVVERLNSLLARLEGAFQRERSFSSDVAHELRTPLSGLHTTLEVALSQPRSGEDYQTAMSQCLTICRQMERMVESLLMLARFEADQVALRAERVSVRHLVAKCWQSFKSEADERGLDVSWDIENSYAIETDPDKIRIVLNNLFDNAVSHADEQGTISLRLQTDADWLSLDIANSASAIEAEHSDRLFDRFWQADTARQSNGRHFGLGLGLCKRVVERLGGEIKIRTGDGQFRVSLSLPPRLAVS
jgi:heavy metal sensor kinase